MYLCICVGGSAMKLLGSARGQRGGEWHGLVDEETGPCITINTTRWEARWGWSWWSWWSWLLEVLHEHDGSLPQEASGPCITINTIFTIFLKRGFWGCPRLVIGYLVTHQGGRTWRAFGGGKHGHETFRQARNCNFRNKCVVFVCNLKFSNLTQ